MTEIIVALIGLLLCGLWALFVAARLEAMFETPLEIGYAIVLTGLSTACIFTVRRRLSRIVCVIGAALLLVLGVLMIR